MLKSKIGPAPNRETIKYASKAVLGKATGGRGISESRYFKCRIKIKLIDVLIFSVRVKVGVFSNANLSIYFFVLLISF